ncbi:MAG: response regulator [Calditrichaeota bacterium]|nr:MAG: response regulator [Calditrichota bacterium]MBL1205499.1 response regulator [Calditrichota bacterium]NOG45327.1 response regulator [Calditrichota bacterium]
MKIFICEQDQGKAKSMQAILGHYSYKVVTVQKNTDLFKQVNQQRPAVIIVNEGFNENCGVETINRLKNDPETSHIPVIYIGNDNEMVSSLYPPKSTNVEVVQEPVKIKNLKHYIDRWTTFRTLYIKH